MLAYLAAFGVFACVLGGDTGCKGCFKVCRFKSFMLLPELVKLVNENFGKVIMCPEVKCCKTKFITHTCVHIRINILLKCWERLWQWNGIIYADSKSILIWNLKTLKILLKNAKKCWQFCIELALLHKLLRANPIE